LAFSNLAGTGGGLGYLVANDSVKQRKPMRKQRFKFIVLVV